MSEPTIRPSEEIIDEARQALSEAVDQAFGALYGAAVPVALMGPWAEWADAQPVGAVVTVGVKDLSETNDDVIGAVGRALVALTIARQALDEQEAGAPVLRLLK